MFGISQDDEKLKDILEGQGSEYLKIRTLHSSSLCGFLHFFRVGCENKFRLPKEIFNLGDGFLEFDKVYFEVENECVGSHKSSVDVVLTNSEYVLFLELKFSEYLSSNNIDISSSYLEKYNEIFNLGDNDIKFYENNKTVRKEIIKNKLTFGISTYSKGDFKGKIKYEKDDDGNVTNIPLFSLTSLNKGSFYIGGIKQMISHYIGIKNLIKNSSNNNDHVLKNDLNKQILYAEMVFKFNNNEANIKFDNFNDAYLEVKKILEKLDNKKIIYANNVLNYREIFAKYNSIDSLLTENTKKFYKYKE